MTALATPDPLVLDLVDKQILRGLQLNPRAPFSRVAAGLACSEQTVARRYRRLVQAGAVRVIAAVDPRALGESDWVVRVRTRPESSLDVARALCRRDDVAWVSVGAASEVVCAVRSHTARDREGLLVHRLPRSAAVLDVSASVVLRHFVGGSASDWVGLSDVLTAEQEAAIGRTERRRHMGPAVATLDPADYAMLEVLMHDGRAGYGQLARAAGVTEGRAARRLAALVDSGAVYFDVDLASSLLGFPVSAYLWLTVAPAELDAACRTLATHAEAPFVAAVSGQANVVVSVTCRNLDELYRYTTDRLGVIAGVQAIEVAPMLRKLKQAGALVDGDRLAVG